MTAHPLPFGFVSWPPRTLLLGVIEGDFSVIINGVQVLAEEFVDDGVINLGSSFGPNTCRTSDLAPIQGAIPSPGRRASSRRRAGRVHAVVTLVEMGNEAFHQVELPRVRR